MVSSSTSGSDISDCVCANRATIKSALPWQQKLHAISLPAKSKITFRSNTRNYAGVSCGKPSDLAAPCPNSMASDPERLCYTCLRPFWSCSYFDAGSVLRPLVMGCDHCHGQGALGRLLCAGFLRHGWSCILPPFKQTYSFLDEPVSSLRSWSLFMALRAVDQCSLHFLP